MDFLDYEVKIHELLEEFDSIEEIKVNTDSVIIDSDHQRCRITADSVEVSSFTTSPGVEVELNEYLDEME